MKNKKIIIFSSVDWEINWQIHHEIATRLSRNNDVLFVENLGSRHIKFKDLNRIFPRILRWIKSKSGFLKINKSLHTYTPLFIPFHFTRIFINFNESIILNDIYKWINFKYSDEKKIIIISFIPIPLIRNIIQKINPIVSIYYCADNMTLNNKFARLNENRFIKKVDHIFYTSENLKKKVEINPSNYLLSSGVNIKKFIGKFKKKKINKKEVIFGYIGSVREIFDLELIYAAAQILKNCKFIIVGPVFVDVSKLKKLPNIQFIGYVSHSKVSKYINSFDVCLMPYIKNNFSKSIYPVKLNEYLFMRKPIFSTRIPEIVKLRKELKNAIYFIDKPIDFKKNLKLFLLNKLNEKKLINFAKKNDWATKFTTFTNIINKILISKLKKSNQEQNNIKNNFIFYINTKKFYFYKFIFFLVIISLIIKYTPLFWYLGENLIIRGEYKKADALVVFSGDGSNSYINNSYQSRVLDILPLIKNNYVKKIILSSGREQTFTEEKLIKSLLVSYGVREEQIFLVERYPKTTYENILFVKEKLDELKIDNFLFVTAPFHTKRATLIWKKNFSNLTIYNVTPNDAQSQKPVWITDVKSVQIIFYEYASILYNRLLNRL